MTLWKVPVGGSRAYKLALAAVAALFVSACWLVIADPGEHMEVCVQDQRGLDSFLMMMRELARLKGMEFVDGSEQSRILNEKTRKERPEYKFTEPVVFFGIREGNKIWIQAGNSSLRSYQIAIGFVGDEESAEVIEWKRRIREAIGGRWPIKMIPSGQGSLPSEDCPNAPVRP